MYQNKYFRKAFHSQNNTQLKAQAFSAVIWQSWWVLQHPVTGSKTEGTLGASSWTRTREQSLLYFPLPSPPQQTLPGIFSTILLIRHGNFQMLTWFLVPSFRHIRFLPETWASLEYKASSLDRIEFQEQDGIFITATLQESEKLEGFSPISPMTGSIETKLTLRGWHS